MFRHKKPEHAGAWLSEVAFFEGFSPDELDRVAELASEAEAEEGAQLMDQGRPGMECFVILEGEAGVFVRDEHIATLGAGDMVGEMALIDHKPRSASVVAATPMRLLAFDTKRFRTLLDEMPKASQRVAELLNARLRSRNAS